MENEELNTEIQNLKDEIRLLQDERDFLRDRLREIRIMATIDETG